MKHINLQECRLTANAVDPMKREMVSGTLGIYEAPGICRRISCRNANCGRDETRSHRAGRKINLATWIIKLFNKLRASKWGNGCRSVVLKTQYVNMENDLRRNGENKNYSKTSDNRSERVEKSLITRRAFFIAASLYLSETHLLYTVLSCEQWNVIELKRR